MRTGTLHSPYILQCRPWDSNPHLSGFKPDASNQLGQGGFADGNHEHLHSPTLTVLSDRVTLMVYKFDYKGRNRTLNVIRFRAVDGTASDHLVAAEQGFEPQPRDSESRHLPVSVFRIAEVGIEPTIEMDMSHLSLPRLVSAIATEGFEPSLNRF